MGPCVAEVLGFSNSSITGDELIDSADKSLLAVPEIPTGNDRALLIQPVILTRYRVAPID
jgi:hypothetical protein